MKVELNMCYYQNVMKCFKMHRHLKTKYRIQSLTGRQLSRKPYDHQKIMNLQQYFWYIYLFSKKYLKMYSFIENDFSHT